MARAIEKWGGPSQVAEELAYAVSPRKGRQAAAPVQQHKFIANHQEPASATHHMLESSEHHGQGSSTTKISVGPSSSRGQSVGAKPGQRPPGTVTAVKKQSRQQQDRRPQVPSPVDLEAREKQPIVQNRRRVGIRRKQPRLPTMRQEIDDW